MLYAYGIRSKSRLPSVDGEPGRPRNDGERNAGRGVGPEFGDRREQGPSCHCTSGVVLR